jgi:S-adenosylhomocysteine hydrolase
MELSVEYKVHDMLQADFGRMELHLAEVEMPHGVRRRAVVEGRI